MSALDRQEGGSHYKDMPIQPIEYIMRNGLTFIEGCVVKYATRARAKSGDEMEAWRKIKHYAEIQIEELEGSYRESVTEALDLDEAKRKVAACPYCRGLGGYLYWDAGKRQERTCEVCKGTGKQ